MNRFQHSPVRRTASVLVRRINRAGGFLIAGALCGCALFETAKVTDGKRGWLSSGVLAISRPVPEVGNSGSSAPRMLGFMPNKHSNSTPSVVVERAAKTIHLTISPQRVLQLPAEGAEHLQPGSFPIVLKQTEPVWYAPTRYFRSRGLAVPEEGRKERFRRGALGTKALFLDGQTPIHDGPVWSDEIGGIKLDSEAMTALFDALQVGSRIEVR